MGRALIPAILAVLAAASPLPSSAAGGLTPGLPLCGNDLIITAGQGVGPLTLGADEHAVMATLGPARLATTVTLTPSTHGVFYTGGFAVGSGYIASAGRVRALVVTALAVASMGCRTTDGVSPGVLRR